MHEITASHENCSGCLKFRQKFAAKFAAENCCRKLLRKIAADTKFMRLTICDRTKADVEISAPGKISAPLKLLRL